MPTVLIIAYHFPPDGGGGTQRAAKFCRYLPEFGWRPIVLTRQPPAPDRRAHWDPEDASLLRDVDKVEVVRVPAPEGEPTVPMHPGPNPGSHPWIERASRIADTIIRAQAVDAVLITAPPYGMCGLGERLAGGPTPLIYDLRDPWACDGAPLYSSKAQWSQSAAAMRRSLLTARGVIFNTAEAHRAIAGVVPDVQERFTSTIPNGYDAADFAPSPTESPEGYEPGRFHLLHTGTFHTGAWMKHRGLVGWLRALRQYRAEPIDLAGRTPAPLLEAVRQLVAQRHPLVSKLRVVFAGVKDAATQRLVERSGVAHLVMELGYLPHAASVAWLRAAQGLFLPLHGLQTNRRALIVPGKTYEYLAAGKRILACLPEGDALDLVRRSGNGYIAMPSNPASIASALGQMLDGWTKDAADPAVPGWITTYERRSLTGRLAGLLDRVVGRDANVASAQPVAQERIAL